MDMSNAWLTHSLTHQVTDANRVMISKRECHAEFGEWCDARCADSGHHSRDVASDQRDAPHSEHPCTITSSGSRPMIERPHRCSGLHQRSGSRWRRSRQVARRRASRRRDQTTTICKARPGDSGSASAGCKVHRGRRGGCRPRGTRACPQPRSWRVPSSLRAAVVQSIASLPKPFSSEALGVGWGRSAPYWAVVGPNL